MYHPRKGHRNPASWISDLEIDLKWRLDGKRSSLLIVNLKSSIVNRNDTVVYYCSTYLISIPKGTIRFDAKGFELAGTRWIEYPVK